MGELFPFDIRKSKGNFFNHTFLYTVFPGSFLLIDLQSFHLIFFLKNFSVLPINVSQNNNIGSDQCIH